MLTISHVYASTSLSFPCMANSATHMINSSSIKLTLLCCCLLGAQAQLVRYEHLTPLAGVVDIKGIWKALQLPPLPPTFCHVGLLGWHCHNTTKQPWDPSSLIPKDQLPPMPANASCVICPNGWKGTKRNLIDVLVDLPYVQHSSQLPQGFYDMVKLKADQVSKAQNGTAAP